MDTVSIERRIPLALAENGDVRTTILVNLYVNLSTFTVIFCLSPNFMRVCKMLQSINASTAFDGLGDLFIALQCLVRTICTLICTSMGAPIRG
jgi:hypothetical protein